MHHTRYPYIVSVNRTKKRTRCLHWDEEHVSDDMVQCQCYECSCGPPDGDDLTGYLSTANRDEDREADKPVGADRAKKDLVPVRIARKISYIQHLQLYLVTHSAFCTARLTDAWR